MIVSFAYRGRRYRCSLSYVGMHVAYATFFMKGLSDMKSFMFQVPGEMERILRAPPLPNSPNREAVERRLSELLPLDVKLMIARLSPPTM